MPQSKKVRWGEGEDAVGISTEGRREKKPTERKSSGWSSVCIKHKTTQKLNKVLLDENSKY